MRAASLLLLSACQVALPPEAANANFIAANDKDPGFSLILPECLVVSTDADFLINYTLLNPGARLTVERTRQNGTIEVIERRDLGDALEGSVTVARQAFESGRNHFVFWVHGKELRSDAIALDLIARTPGNSGSLEDADGDCFSPRLGDCNDASAAVFPGQTEVCDDRVDNDCNGNTDAADSACGGMCADSDGDGHGAAYCGGDDCDDGRDATFPGATETCNGVDDDCDAQYDEGFDGDGDGFAACGAGVAIVRAVDGSLCPAGYSTCADCADGDAAITPGDAMQSCK